MLPRRGRSSSRRAHADEARSTFEHAVRSARARFEAAEQRPTSAAQIIARQSVASELRELAAARGAARTDRGAVVAARSCRRPTPRLPTAAPRRLTALALVASPRSRPPAAAARARPAAATGRARVEDRSPRRHRPGEPHVRQLLRPLVHRADRLGADLHRRRRAAARPRPTHDPAGHAPIVARRRRQRRLRSRTTRRPASSTRSTAARWTASSPAPLCGDARNFAYADAADGAALLGPRAGGALADRYFQPIVGAELVERHVPRRARSFVFVDNDVEPDAHRPRVQLHLSTPMSFDRRRTIGDLLDARGVSWTWYAEGYAGDGRRARAGRAVPNAPDDCGAGLAIYPCVFDPGDMPFDYYPQFADNPHVHARLRSVRQPTSTAARCRRSRSSRASAITPSTPGSAPPSATACASCKGVVDAVAKSRLRARHARARRRTTRAAATSITSRRRRRARRRAAATARACR